MPLGSHMALSSFAYIRSAELPYEFSPQNLSYTERTGQEYYRGILTDRSDGFQNCGDDTGDFGKYSTVAPLQYPDGSELEEQAGKTSVM